MKYVIRENYEGNIRSRLIKDVKGNIKEFKTEAKAKQWIRNRMQELDGNTGWEYTIEEC